MFEIFLKLYTEIFKIHFLSIFFNAFSIVNINKHTYL